MNSLQCNFNIQLTSPMFAGGGQGRFEPSTGNLVYTGGVPALRMFSMPLFTNEESRLEQVYGLPANSLRGVLARHCSDAILERFGAEGKGPVSVNVYNALRGGTPTPRPTGDETMAEISLAVNDARFGLFGGTAYIVPGKLEVGMLMAVTKQSSSLIRNGFGVQAVSERATAFSSIRRVDDVAEGSPVEVLKSVKLDDVEQHFTMLTDSREQKNAEQTSEGVSSKKQSLKHYSVIQSLIPGLNMNSSIELKGVNQAQLGLFLEGLKRFFASQQVGAAARIGFGRFFATHASFTVKDADGLREIPIFGSLDTGNITFGADPLISEAINALEVYFESVDPKYFEQFVRPDKTKKGPPAAKKNKKDSDSKDSDAMGAE
jgi:CRISPR type IV-associated protein Csf2